MQKIAAKLVKVMEEVSYVKKNGVNDFHHYKYAMSADVLEKVNAALTKNKLISIALPELINVKEVTTSKGNVEHLVTIKMEIMLVDAESGETVTITGIGSGQDAGDKAVMKAQTAAIKYAYLLSMAISTGDDPEVTSIDKQAESEERKMEQCRCLTCGVSITAAMQKISMKKYGKQLCLKCQKKENSVA